MAITNNLNDYLTISEAAEYMGVSPSNLRNWDIKGKFKAYRHPMNDYRLYLRRDLEKVLIEITKNEKTRSR